MKCQCTLLLFLTTLVMPSKGFLKIREKWPRWFFATPHDKSSKITVQQENARPHTLLDDSKILAAGCTGRFNIRMAQQPANSPDLNVLDLGLFNAIDKLQHKKPHCNVEELIVEVKHAYEDLSPAVINRAFVLLQGVMEQIVIHNGDNNFPIPHMGKCKTEKELGELPFQHHLSLKAKRKAHRLWRQQCCSRHIEMWGRMIPI